MGRLFSLLEQALGTVLAFFYDLLVPPFSEGNGLGLSIILLTIFINILVFPLTLKQTRATRAFQAIQPEIKRLQKEYKDDPEDSSYFKKKVWTLLQLTVGTRSAQHMFPAAAVLSTSVGMIGFCVSPK
jgi:membrane protein insertase Oxa1/YidC/SpoIIIJ